MNESAERLDWRRTSPVAVIFFILNTVRHFLVNGLPAMAVVITLYASSGDTVKSLVMTGLVVLAAAVAVGAVAKWARFRFCIDGDKVLLRSGVFQHEELTIEFGRVQNVSIKEPIYMRPFSLALLTIDTAGSGQKEIVLGGIGRNIATELRDVILSRIETEKTSADETSAEPQDRSLLLSRSVKDIVIYGLTVNLIIWVALAVGAFFGAGDFAEKVLGMLSDYVQYEDVVATIDRLGGAVGATLVGILALFLLFLLLPLISVIGALIRHYGYELRVDGETYRRTSGLLTRHDESMKRHKIQAAVLKQNFIARLFNRTNMQLRIASAGSGIENGQLPIGPKAAFLVPALNDEELDRLVTEFLPECQYSDARLSHINRRRFFLVIIGWTILPPLLLVTAILSSLLSLWLLLIPLVGLAVAVPIVNQVWKKAGYGVVGDYGVIRQGFWGTETTVFPLFKVQRVEIRQTPGQRRKGLAHLSIHLASHSLKLSYVPEEDAKRFRDLALFYVESSNRAWF